MSIFPQSEMGLLDELDGLSFRDAFQQIVMRDPDVYDAIYHVADWCDLPELQSTIEFALSLSHLPTEKSADVMLGGVVFCWT